MIPLERERSLADAETVIRAFVSRQGWRIRIQAHGERLQSTVCTLHDGDDEVIASGFGKGDGEAARVGAIYEAVEHLYTNAPPAGERIDFVPSIDLFRDPRYAGLPFLSAFEQNPQQRLACRTYRPFFDDGDAVPVPLFLTFPNYLEKLPAEDDFDYSSVIRYGSNSGIAIGASVEEAAVHAIGELVERDSWSLFLVAHFLGEPASLGSVIDPQSLPPQVAAIHAAASAQLGRGIVLIEVTSDLGFPAFIATTDRILDDEVVYPSGFGASLYAAHAAIRALTELVQCVGIREQLPSMHEYSRLALDALAEYRKLRDCAYFQVSTERLETVDWSHPTREVQTPKALLRDMVSLLQRKGIHLYHAINHRQGDDFCVVSCVSFELERFLLVASGIAMAPGKRGMDLLAGKLQVPALERAG